FLAVGWGGLIAEHLPSAQALTNPIFAETVVAKSDRFMTVVTKLPNRKENHLDVNRCLQEPWRQYAELARFTQ
ncbi:MAG TPA: hypothetical protein VG102_03695, partial [Candidatus Paceibacterota bacterium]|nr:hypothetical protein [Candidatus Paceibacterota bacterium]